MPTEPRLKMLPGMMPILHSPAVITPGQFGPIRRDFEPAERALHPHHVEHRDALGDADDQRDLGVDRLADRVGGDGRRHVDRRWRRAGLLARLGDGVEDRQAEVVRAALARRDAADHLRAVGDRLLGMEGAVLPVKPWQMTLVFLSTRMDMASYLLASFTALTIFCAASSRSSAGDHVEARARGGSSCPARHWCLRAAPPAAPAARPPSPPRRRPRR